MLLDGVLRIDLSPAVCATNAAHQGAAEGMLPTDDGCFVAGPENRLPILALENLLVGQSRSISPCSTFRLVLAGPQGCGKSMLARAVARRWLPILGDEHAAYLTAIDFARRWAVARTEGQLAEFRKQLMQLQLLVLEDLHKLPAKSFVQNGLRNLLDHLQSQQATVLCTSQRVPSTLSSLEPGLRDRLSGGLLLCLNHPGSAARLEILRLLAAERNTLVEDHQLRVLANAVTGSAAQLKRALQAWEMNRQGVNMPQETTETVRPKAVVPVVARYFSITQSALRGPARRQTLVLARGFAVLLLRSLTSLSYSDIGRELGNRDHTTILHAKRAMDKKLQKDSTLQHSLEELQRILLAV